MAAIIELRGSERSRGLMLSSMNAVVVGLYLNDVGLKMLHDLPRAMKAFRKRQ